MNQWLPGLLLVCCCACSRAETASLDAANSRSQPSPTDVLDGLDNRTALPLLPMMANHQKQSMRDHLVAVQEIVGALAKSDFAAVKTAAQRLGFSDQMGRMCTHMGSGAPGFSAQAIAFHRTADRIATAAENRDTVAVMRELDVTLQSCTACHAAWKQHVVSDARWNELSAGTQSSGHSSSGRVHTPP
jgi:hypothetical protein